MGGVSVEEKYLNTDAPYKAIYEERDSFKRKQLLEKADLEAKQAGFGKFRSTYKEYAASRDEKKAFDGIDNYTDVDGQPLTLITGEWTVDESGVHHSVGMGDEYACRCPVYITRIFENIDDGTSCVELYYKTYLGRTRQLIIKCSQYANPKELVKLSDMGLGINLRMAQVLSDYLNDIYAANLNIIPHTPSVGRLGWISEKEFSPYMDGLVFDGGLEYESAFKAVHCAGSEELWLAAARHFRHESIAAHIVLAASFASVLIKPLGTLPFFVHLWGVDSGTGKTVALMAAASVWANPETGMYIKTFDGTDVGFERIAAFLNSMPMCIDELQLSRDRYGKPLFNVYRLAQGVGRVRGNRSGSVDVMPTWANAILTTGESPLVTDSAGAGAVNRVIDIECASESVVCNFGHEYSEQFKSHFGFAGKRFVEKLLEPGAMERVKELYNTAFERLNTSSTTEKQAHAAAAIVAADELATEWIFQDDYALKPEEIAPFLASTESVSLGARAYEYICGWVISNSGKFEDATAPAYSPEIYGRIVRSDVGDYAYIICNIFNTAMESGGFSPKSAISYMKSHKLCKIGKDGKPQIKYRVQSSTTVRCIAVLLPQDSTS